MFDTVFGRNNGNDKKAYVNWITLDSSNQLEVIRKLSKSETILIFKHSTRCVISSMVKKQFENAFNSSMRNLKVYYLDVLSFRNISNEVSQTYKVVHQSPQLLIIKNETVVVHASHHDIVQVQIASYL